MTGFWIAIAARQEALREVLQQGPADPAVGLQTRRLLYNVFRAHLRAIRRRLEADAAGAESFWVSSFRCQRKFTANKQLHCSCVPARLLTLLCRSLLN